MPKDRMTRLQAMAILTDEGYRFWERSCCLKKPYRRKAEAERAIEGRPPPPRGRVLATYLCRFCDHWHVGNQKKFWWDVEHGRRPAPSAPI